MAKNQKAAANNPEDGAAAPVKRQRGKASYLSQLFPFVGELKTYAEGRYQSGRFDKDVPDDELASRDKLRKVLADFPLKG